MPLPLTFGYLHLTQSRPDDFQKSGLGELGLFCNRKRSVFSGFGTFAS
jgi:hypothetical protein